MVIRKTKVDLIFEYNIEKDLISVAALVIALDPELLLLSR